MTISGGGVGAEPPQNNLLHIDYTRAFSKSKAKTLERVFTTLIQGAGMTVPAGGMRAEPPYFFDYTACCLLSAPGEKGYSVDSMQNTQNNPA
jgi:hypothetical protein